MLPVLCWPPLNFSFPVDRMNSLRAQLRRPTVAQRAMFYRTRGTRDEGSCMGGVEMGKETTAVGSNSTVLVVAAGRPSGVDAHCAAARDLGTYFLRLRRWSVERPGRGVASDLWKPESRTGVLCHFTSRCFLPRCRRRSLGISERRNSQCTCR